jgi:hypothetical protein
VVPSGSGPDQISEEEQARADIEAGMEAHREIVANSGNAAARSRSASELIRLARELERLRAGPMAVEDARAELDRRLDETRTPVVARPGLRLRAHVQR